MSFAILEQMLLGVEATRVRLFVDKSCQLKHVIGGKSTPKETVLLWIAPLLQQVMLIFR